MKNLIEVNNICKTYPGFTLKNIHFQVPAGSIVGLIGENGAGMSTTIKAILDMIRLDSGSISVLGKDHQKDGHYIRVNTGTVIDDANFHETLTPDQVRKFMCKIYKSWDNAYYDALLERFSLPKNKKIGDFSKGMKMKFLISTALAHRPKLLILDEATSGLDPVVRDEILDMLLEFIQDENHGVLMSSHITSDLEKVADYITFIHKGEVFLSDEKDQIMESYGIIRCAPEDMKKIPKEYILGVNQGMYRMDILISDRKGMKEAYPELVVDPIRLEDILIFKVKGDR